SYTFRVIGANADGAWNYEGARLAIAVVPPFWRTSWFMALCALGITGIGIFIYEQRLRRLRRAHANQTDFSRQLIESQERERKRIAAELHDSLGQNLLVIKNRALLGVQATTGDDRAREQFDEISDAVNEVIEEVREISYDLRPFHLDRLGLKSAIEAMIEKVSAASGIAFTVDLIELDRLFNKDVETNFYRVVQECVNNIVKHSEASQASIIIARDARALQLTISDNGRGFSTTGTGVANGRGFGLTGIAERVRLLGGTHTISSTPHKGTRINITLRLAEQQKEARRGA
ncbi:MAG TPA: sensor histidine kinase, partial [Pyrinomonadaceae bacterium]|nr:sensor histidine kinase [Pyrinomonadaceae bacterium]